MVTQPWLLLTYKVPPEPAAKRIALWRRLKGMGAVYLQNGVCLLPKTDDHIRRLKMLENDVALKKLQIWLERIGKLDFYGAARAAEAAERLHHCETLLDAYAKRVFDA